jgi:putative transposase
MVVHKAFKFRIYPTEAQKRDFANQFGSSRFVYKHFLRQRIDFYAAHKGEKKQSLSYGDTASLMTKMKKQTEFEWLRNANSQSLQQSLRNLDIAYNNFFLKRGQFPKFKNKHAKQSFGVPQHFKLDVERKLLTLPKIGAIKIVPHRTVEGCIRCVTISKNPSERYYASFLCEVEIEPKKTKTRNEIGIDLGIKSFAVTSDKEIIEAPKFFRGSERKLAILQRRLGRKKNGSNRRANAKLKVAQCHEKIANQRMDFLHKESRRLVDDNQAIYLESLNVLGMVTNHCLAKSIFDASWGEFVRQLEYKSIWYGSRIGRVDRFFPSSKRCHHCGYIKQDLTLKDREWSCPECLAHHERDVNAAKNILIFGKDVPPERRKRNARGDIRYATESLNREATPL